MDNLPPAKHSSFLIASGVLAIVASCFALLVALISLVAGGFSYGYGGGIFLITGFLGVTAFVSGLTAGVLALKKISFRMVIMGEIWVFLVAIIMSALVPGFGFLFGIPIFVLSILGAIFTAVAKSSFNY
jgi:hypothetical protein